MYKKQKQTAHSRSSTPSLDSQFPCFLSKQYPSGTVLSLTCLPFDGQSPPESFITGGKSPFLSHRLLHLTFLSTLVCSFVNFPWNYLNQILLKFLFSRPLLTPTSTYSYNSTVIFIMEENITWIRFWSS